ncbi:unnamed protein product [Diatraea saccharalis]|uniref:Uncharacterized protein n=1 Tax=Diatraea saccharalis TaxID=40085 RepID=A0A9N9RAN2_9NEOP|nr:unnamed protein product [Diatraea saccharalis]
MMTRKALARQEESKFQITLQELKATKELVEQLLREREDNEKELLDVLEKNKQCKKELSELHCNYLIITEEKDRLQLVIEGFDQCRSEYEKALRLISGLEQQLKEANDCIYKLESEQTKVMASQNQSLYDELVGCAPSLVSASLNINPVTIGLTTEDFIECSVKRGVVKCSRNRLRKYIKLNRSSEIPAQNASEQKSPMKFDAQIRSSKTLDAR